MSLFEELTWRGFIHQVTHNDLAERLETQSFTAYVGFDPTADSLHIGHLLPVIGLMRLQRFGHRPIALVGGGTGMIGDPSFKSEERRLLSSEDIDRNAAGVRAQLERFLDFSGPRGALLLNNLEWLGELRLIDFLRDIGKLFSVNVMMARESVKQRLENRDQGISFTEFTYSLLQAYDFLHLCQTHDCRIQMGGSDQWGNIVAGMDLTRRLENKDTYGITFPLLEKSDGTKFGKTEAGAVWLDPKRTSPYKFYQFWINQADADTSRLLRLFTFLSREEVEGLDGELREAPEKRTAQRRLAEEVTRLVHGDDALNQAVHASQAMFGGSLSGLDDATLEDIFSEVPSSDVPRDALSANRLLLDVLVESAVVKSKGEGKRLVQNGGLYLNNERVTQEDARLSADSLCGERIAVIRSGKKNYHLLRFVG
ncbi:MAG: tyrosine--tRNA ligase [Candidatus Hydrogenedentes bacterium]|nr:tyrosine--tRNA ligase [Candidatus Hydrogenedentota bacterium]